MRVEVSCAVSPPWGLGTLPVIVRSAVMAVGGAAAEDGKEADKDESKGGQAGAHDGHGELNG